VTAYEHIAAAIAEVLPKINPDELKRGIRPSSIVAARLFPYIEAATSSLLAAADLERPAEEQTDRRAKPWQAQLRIWSGEELVAETDPEVIDGTGQLPELVEDIASQLHETAPAELQQANVRGMLPQLRNNLARQKSAVLRIEYTAPDLSEDPRLAGRAAQYLCQVDVFRLA
jgi:hypothetical protein